VLEACKADALAMVKLAEAVLKGGATELVAVAEKIINPPPPPAPVEPTTPPAAPVESKPAPTGKKR
jgi:hypothetical protein